MNNPTRNLKMKKLLIASTALVATAGMANAEIVITGHAAAGIYSGLDYVAPAAAVPGVVTAAEAATTAVTIAADTNVTSTEYTALAAIVTTETADLAAANLAQANQLASGQADNGEAAAVTAAAAALATAVANLNAAAGTAAVAEGRGEDGIYSNAGVDFTMTGETNNGITFSATVNIDAGTEIDAGDFELDGPDGGTAGLGAVSMTGTFGTLTFDDAGIDNLYDDDLAAADVSFSRQIGDVSLTIAHDTAAGSANANSFSAGYSASGMAFTLSGTETAAGTSNSLAMSYALNDTVSMTAETDQAAGAESVQTIGATTTLNGVSVSVSSANNSTWDVDLGYTAGAYVLSYGVDETDAWTATATSDLGGNATFSAGVSSDNEMYAGVSFTF